MSDSPLTPEPQSPESSRIAIGLAFGNSNSSIAYTSQTEGKAEVIANEEGDRQIPSILSYVAGEEFQGTQAKEQIARNPRNTIAFWRDFLGKGFKDVDPSNCHASAHPVELDGGRGVGFEVQENETVEGEAEGKKSTLDVGEVTTRHLRRLKDSASDYLGKTVNAAVITVPYDFTDAQKTALTAAAKAADVEVLQFIPEPVAALLGHDAKIQQAGEQNQPQHHDRTIVVADLGGTRSDVAVIASRGGMYTTLSTAHDYELGGSTLDKVLVEHAAKAFVKQYGRAGADPRTNERSLAKLTLEAESVRKALSLGASASFSVESLSDGIDFSLSVNRSRFELLANKTLMSFTRLIESAVQKADLDVLDIDTILLAGGASHTPKIAANLASRFPASTTIISPSTDPHALNPSELTARGAAIQASLIQEFEQQDIEDSTEAVVTVTPHLSQAIGLVTGKEGDESFALIVEPDTPVPVRRTAQISVASGGDVLVRLAEGIREIKVSKQDKPATNGAAKDDDDSDDDEDDEPEEVRSKSFKAGKVVAEAGLRAVKKGGKVEVQVSVAGDLGVTVVVREVGGKGGVRGSVEGTGLAQNGSA